MSGLGVFLVLAALLGLVLTPVGLIQPRWIRFQDRKQVAKLFLGTLLLFGVGGNMLPSKTNEQSVVATQAIAEVSETSKEIILTSSHKLEEKQLIVSGETNAPDGTIIIAMVMATQPIDIKENRNIIVENGTYSVEFDLQEWTPQEIAYTVTIPFTWKNFKQAEVARLQFGELGEQLIGSTVTEGLDGGKDATISATLAFPSSTAVTQHRRQLMAKASRDFLAELTSINVIIKAEWNERHTDFNRLDVFVTDNWYYTPKHEKERFAEQIGNLLAQWRINLGVAKNRAEDYPTVRIFDRYGKQVAGMSTWGVRLLD